MGFFDEYIAIETDPKDGKKYLVRRKYESDTTRSDPDAMHITIAESRGKIDIFEREHRIKPKHNGEGYRDIRPSTFKGTNAPMNAARYLIETYHLSISDLWGK
jgi:hypothetical protein